MSEPGIALPLDPNPVPGYANLVVDCPTGGKQVCTLRGLAEGIVREYESDYRKIDMNAIKRNSWA